jgi:hypothetical protein
MVGRKTVFAFAELSGVLRLVTAFSVLGVTASVARRVAFR